jgi:predicted  nucleic acid-binding Zn-ribbon protein
MTEKITEKMTMAKLVKKVEDLAEAVDRLEKNEEDLVDAMEVARDMLKNSGDMIVKNGETITKIGETQGILTEGALRAEGSLATLGKQMIQVNSGMTAVVHAMDQQLSQILGKPSGLTPSREAQDPVPTESPSPGS